MFYRKPLAHCLHHFEVPDKKAELLASSFLSAKSGATSEISEDWAASHLSDEIRSIQSEVSDESDVLRTGLSSLVSRFTSASTHSRSPASLDVAKASRPVSDDSSSSIASGEKRATSAVD